MRLTELNLFPLKSGGGTPLRTAVLTPKGLSYDREFMLITPDGRFLSQREVSRLALLRPSYDGEVLVRGREPLRTLATYRTIGRGIRFGQNGVPRTLGTINVGDPVEILERRP